MVWPACAGCGTWRGPRYTWDQARRTALAAAPLERGPKARCSDATLVDEIRAVLAAAPFLGEGHRKLWARLRWQGVRTSKVRVLRLMREAQLLAPTRAGRAHGPTAHDGTITTERPNQMWGKRRGVPGGFVALRPGRSVPEAALLEHCRGKLVAFKVPAALVVVDAVPKNANGKLDRDALAAVWQWQQRGA